MRRVLHLIVMKFLLGPVDSSNMNARLCGRIASSGTCSRATNSTSCICHGYGLAKMLNY